MNADELDGLKNLDRAHLWHPFTANEAAAGGDLPIITRAEGARLFDSKGRAVLDGISSWWCVNLGHRHPRIVEAIRKQLDVLDQSILGGMSHPPAVRLAAAIAEITPAPLTRVLFASDGAAAVEAAMKVAIQYFSNIDRPGKHRFAALVDGYHGDTLGALGAGYVQRFHSSFAPAIVRAHQAASPHCFHCPCGCEPSSCNVECFESMEQIVTSRADELAAVIVEPLCQGAAGMRIYPAQYIRRLRRLCDDCDVLLIADEIAVGMGRTGRMFACEHAGVSPDILCLGKALTGGHLPLSATVVTDDIYRSFANTPDRERTFFHGHTFAGNPIAAAAALATLEVFRSEDILEGAKPTSGLLAERFDELAGLSCVHKTAALGMMAVLEVSEQAGGAGFAAEVARRAWRLGLFIRPLGPVLYLLPPLTTTTQQANQMTDALAAAMQAP